MVGTASRLAVTLAGGQDLATALDGVTADPTLSVTTVGADAVIETLAETDCLLLDQGATENWQSLLERVTDARPHLPVVVLVAADFESTVAAALEAGATDYFPRSLCASRPSVVADRLASIAGPTLEDTSRELFENVADGLVLHDPDTGIIADVNERFCELTGYAQDELVGEHIDVVTAPDHGYEAATDRIQQASTGESQLFEWRNQRPDGETYPVEVHLSVVRIEGEAYVLASVRDITERKRREREFEEIFHGVQDAIIVMDPDTLDILEANDAYLDMVGYERLAEIQRLGVEGLSVTEEGYTVEEGQAVHQRVAETGEPEIVEWQAETKDGDKRWLEVKIAPAVIGGQAVHVTSHRDITERKRREREFEQIFNGVHGGITINDPETGELLAVNDSFCELLGYDREEILDRGTPGISATDEGFTMERARAIIREVIETGESKTFEWTVETAAGDRRLLEVTGTPATINGEPRYVSVTRDITERKRRQREFEQIFNGVNDAVAVHDPATGEIVSVNDTFCALTGYDRETLFEIGAEGLTDDTEAFAPEQIPEIIERVMDGEDLDPYEQAIRTADGEQRWLAVNPTRAVIEGQERFVAIARDVTARRERQQRLQRERDRRGALFENNPDPVVGLEFTDGEPVIREVNPAFERVFGFDSETVVGSTVGEALVPERERERYERFRDTVAAGETIEREAPRETADGIRQFVFRVIQLDGTATDSYVWYTDVTERRRREQAIRTLQEGTARMQRADDFDTVATIASEVARDALELPETRCFLHEADTDRLEPLGQGSSLGPESAAYDAFAEETVTEYTPETGPLAAFERALLLPLGEHGLLAAEVEPGADDVLRDVARTLAEQTTTALRRVARAREVRDSQRRLQAIIDRIDEAVFLAPAPQLDATDPSPDFVSSGYEGIWGQSLQTIHETHAEGFFGTLAPEAYEPYVAFIEEVMAAVERGEYEDRYEYEYRIERPDGEIRWVHSDFYPMEWAEGPRRLLIVSRDITDRRERERTLESFHDATAELTTTDTVAEAGEIAVTAAAEVFDLPATAVYRYDAETARLDPTATGPDAPATSDLPPVTADNGDAWDAFVGEGLQRVSATGDSPLAGPGEEVLLFPLGGNGLLAVWQSGESLDTDAASILAATLEAALNRLRGERQLQSRQAELEAQTERARRLDAIAELTQRVDAAITENSSRQGVQEAVCTELIDVEPFVGAWIAAAEVGTDRLTPRAVAGLDRDHVEQVLQGDQADPHPAIEAWQSGEVSVVNDLVGSGRRSDWRQLLLKRGAGAVCAVPLSYNGITDGVLTVVAAEPGAFGDRELEVLSGLRTSIGYALTAIERRRALESDDTLELEFEGHDLEIPPARLAREGDCRVRHERTVRRQDGSVSVYYTLVDSASEIQTIAAETLPGEVTVVSRQDSETVIERQGSSWFGSLVSEYGGVLRRCRATPGGTTLVVELPQEASTRRIVDRLGTEYPGLELTAQRQHRETAATPGAVRDRLEQRLSDRQYEALEVGHEMGYFEWPRESSGEDVADRLDITQPTVNKHIRLGERKVFDLLFDS